MVRSEVAPKGFDVIATFADGSTLTQEYNEELKRWEGIVRHPDGTVCALAFPKRWPIYDILRMQCEHTPMIADGQGGRERASFGLWGKIDRGEYNPDDPWGEGAAARRDTPAAGRAQRRRDMKGYHDGVQEG